MRQYRYSGYNSNTYPKRYYSMKAKLTPEEYLNLIVRIRSNNQADSAIAGEHLIFAIREYLIGFSYSFFKELDEDILIEALHRIWDKLHQFDSERSSFPTWATTIFKHLMYRRTKLLNKRKSVEQLSDNTFDSEMAGAAVYQEEFELEEARDVFKDTISIVQTNPDFHMLYKHYIQGYSYNDLCEELDIPLQTVKNRMRRQRILLQELVNA